MPGKYRLEIMLRGLPPTTNGSHGHWATHSQMRKKWRTMSFVAAMGKKPDRPLDKVKITCTRFSSSESDYDNRAISFKPIIDGLKDAGIILDDTDSVIVDRKYPWFKTPRKEGRVTVVVEEV